MPSLSANSSVTVTLGDQGSLNVTSNFGFGAVQVTQTVGPSETVNFGPTPYRRTFGPYKEGASVTITTQSASVDYQDYGFTGSSSSSSVTSAGGGTDWKLATDDTAPSGGVRVDTYTDDSGLIWTRNYNDAGDGSLQNETALGGALTRTWSYTSGGIGYISAGAVRKSGGAYSVLAADMASIRTELITLGTAADAPQFWVSDYDNGTGATGLTVEWDKANAGFMNVNRRNLYWNANLAQTHSSGTESSALVTVSIPGWLAHKNCMTGIRARFDKASGTDTFAINAKVNTTTVRSASSANLYLQMVGTLVARNATNAWERPSAASGFDISAGTSGAVPVLDTFDQTAGLSFTVTMQRTAGSTDSATFRFLQIWREF